MKTIQGTITSLKTLNTARVRVERKWQHPLYKKFVKRTSNFLCHYTDLKLAEGDMVEIQECAPISKLKHFKVISKITLTDSGAAKQSMANAVRPSAQKGKKV